MKITLLLSALLFATTQTNFAQCNGAVPLPYLENFDSTLPPDLPDCTYSYKQTFVGSEWECSTAPNNSFSGNVGRYSTYSDVGWGMMCDYILRPVELTAGITYKVSYKYAQNDDENPIDKLGITLFANGQPTQIELALHQSISGTEIVNHATEFTVTTNDTYYLRFSIETSGNQGILYLDDIKIEEMGTTGIADPIVSQMIYYPNPVKDKLTVTNTTDGQKLKLYSITGQQVLAQTASETSTVLNLENIPSGVYMLKTGNDNTKAVPLIKE